MAAKKGGLGKGLSAIFLENDNESAGSTVLPISEIEPNRSQPRHDFDEESLRELADSIAVHGITIGGVTFVHCSSSLSVDSGILF